jgi:hypothetical protein
MKLELPSGVEVEIKSLRIYLDKKSTFLSGSFF